MSPVRVFFRLAFGLSWGLGLLGLCWPGGLAVGSPLLYLAGYSISAVGVG